MRARGEGAGAYPDRATAETIATRGPGNGGNTRQSGLVNVGVLARQLRSGGAECDATADAIADDA